MERRTAWRVIGVASSVIVGAACSSGQGYPAVTTPPTTSPPSTTIPAETFYSVACARRITVAGVVPVRSDLVIEASGIVASRQRRGWFWTHNDSGDVPRFFGVGPSGQVQVVSVTGADAVDWEDIEADHTAAGDGLWLADIGDNLVKRQAVDLYRVPEPAAGAGSVAAARLTLTYPDGPHNAEALLRDPATGTLFILTKEPGTSRIYTFAPPAAGGGSGDLQFAGTFPVGLSPGGQVTGADIAPDRSAIAVRTYGGVWIYRLHPGQSVPDALRTPPCRAPHAAEKQGEAITFLPNSRGYATVGEGAHPRIVLYGEDDPVLVH